jgi:hypothetical protein
MHYDEAIYGVEGVKAFGVEGNPVDIGTGQTCYIPRGAVRNSWLAAPIFARAAAPLKSKIRPRRAAVGLGAKLQAALFHAQQFFVFHLGRQNHAIVARHPVGI